MRKKAKKAEKVSSVHAQLKRDYDELHKAYANALRDVREANARHGGGLMVITNLEKKLAAETERADFHQKRTQEILHALNNTLDMIKSWK